MIGREIRAHRHPSTTILSLRALIRTLLKPVRAPRRPRVYRHRQQQPPHIPLLQRSVRRHALTCTVHTPLTCPTACLLTNLPPPTVRCSGPTPPSAFAGRLPTTACAEAPSCRPYTWTLKLDLRPRHCRPRLGSFPGRVQLAWDSPMNRLTGPCIENCHSVMGVETRTVSDERILFITEVIKCSR